MPPIVSRARRTCRHKKWGTSGAANYGKEQMQAPLSFFIQSALLDGSCAAVSDSHQAACGGCSVTHPDASRNWCNFIEILSAARCWKRPGLPLLSSSAQVFCSPAKCVTRSSTWCRAAHAAVSFKKLPRGSAVLQSFSAPASAAVLSEAAGRQNVHCFAPNDLCAVIARAS